MTAAGRVGRRLVRFLVRSNLLVAGSHTRILGRAAMSGASAFQVAPGLAGSGTAGVGGMALGRGMGHGEVSGVVQVAVGVEEDPPVLAPQHRCRAGGGAWVDEVTQVECGGYVGVFDEVNAVAAGRDRVGGAS